MLLKSSDNLEISEVRKVCTAFANTTNWANLAPHIAQAEQDFIIPFLSQAQYDVIEPLYQAGIASGKNLVLINKAQAALGYFTAYLFSKINGVTLANTGNQENTPNSSTPARQWVTRDQQESFLNLAYSNLDAMLAYLEANKSDFTAWAASTSFTQTHTNFINTTAEFNNVVNIGNSMQVFLALRNYIKHTSLMFIEPVLGTDLYDDLLQGIQTGAVPSVAADKLISKIREALGYLVMAEALPLLPVKITTLGPRIYSVNDSIVQNLTAPDKQYNDYLAKIQQLAATHLARLKDFLIKNTSDYPLFVPPTEDQPDTYKVITSENGKVVNF